MKTGTCYFPSYGAALRYYRPYVGEGLSHCLPVAGLLESEKQTCRAKDCEARALVDQKLNSGEIHIGKPPTKPGDVLTIEDNRYHVTEAEPVCPRCNVSRSERIPCNARRCLNCHAEWNITEAAS